MDISCARWSRSAVKYHARPRQLEPRHHRAPRAARASHRVRRAGAQARRKTRRNAAIFIGYARARQGDCRPAAAAAPTRARATERRVPGQAAPPAPSDSDSAATAAAAARAAAALMRSRLGGLAAEPVVAGHHGRLGRDVCARVRARALSVQARPAGRARGGGGPRRPTRSALMRGRALMRI